jgi:hypothetical protein
MALRTRLLFPDQPGASEFDNTNVTRFVKKWDDIYKNCEIKAVKKTRHIPKYMTRVIEEYIRAQEEYEKRD